MEAENHLGAACVVAMSGNMIAWAVSIDPNLGPLPVDGVKSGDPGDDVDKLVRECQLIQCLTGW